MLCLSDWAYGGIREEEALYDRGWMLVSDLLVLRMI